MENKKDSRIRELMSLAKRNGRTLSQSGELWCTADRQDGSDSYCGSLEDCLEWERGYFPVSLLSTQERRSRQ